MPVLKRRTRIVSFRLSEEEYEVLFASCVSNGARSLSDYARSATCRPLDKGKPSAADRKAERSIRQLRNRVDELDRVIQQLTIQIDPHRALEGEPVRMDRTDLNDLPPPGSTQRRAR
jgi:hypothetical protein